VWHHSLEAFITHVLEPSVGCKVHGIRNVDPEVPSRSVEIPLQGHRADPLAVEEDVKPLAVVHLHFNVRPAPTDKLRGVAPTVGSRGRVGPEMEAVCVADEPDRRDPLAEDTAVACAFLKAE